MRNYVAAAALLLLSVCGFSQTPGDMPVIVPPSPELASLANVGSVSTSLHTGGASVSVPLYEIKAGTITVPVALNYFTNGIRVNDIASRAGLGWNLVAGGNVSRTIHDEEDDAPATIQHPLPASLVPTSGNTDLINYLKQASWDNYDTERDEYNFSVGGVSGKFFIDDNGVPRITNHNNVQIVKGTNSFTLTTADGVKYLFGNNGQVEKTHGYQVNGVGRWDKMSTTGWFLTSITSPQGDVVTFNYSDIFIKTLQGASQSVILKAMGVPSSGDPNCEYVCTGRWSDPVQNRLDYDTKYLTSITTSNGQQVYFIYETRGDEGGDNRLKRVLIHANDGSTSRLIKQYEFEYDNYPITNDWNLRFYLKKLYQHSTQLIPNTLQPDETLVYQFDYNDPSGLPSQRSYSQDHYGYANGVPANVNYNFFTKPSDYALFQRGNEGADRSPSFVYTQKGALKKVTYPTGGSEEFFYEPHTLPQAQVQTIYNSYDERAGTGANWYNMNEYSTSITTNSVAKVRVVHETNSTPTSPGNVWTPDNQHPIAIFQIIKTSNSQVVYQSRHDNYGSNDVVITSGIEPNTAYTLKLQVWSASVYSKARVEFDAVETPYWANNEVCGMRVQKIYAYDPVAKLINKKFYRYSSMDIPAKSSGIGMAAPITDRPYPNAGYCELPTLVGYQFLNHCDGMTQISSSSLSGSFTFSGSPVAYQYVIESNDSLNANGTTEHEFITEYNSTTVEPILGIIMPGSPGDIRPTLNGTEIRTRYFKKTSGNYILLKEQRNVYKGDFRHNYSVFNYLIRQRWDPQPSPTVEEKALAYDFGKYRLTSFWYHLDSTYMIDYDQDGQNPMTSYTTYEYGSVTHQQPTKITTLNSKGETQEVVNKYPEDYATTPYTTMVTKHIITPVIEAKTKTGSTWINTSQTEYANWSSPATVIKPSVVKMAKGTDGPEPRLRFYNYDSYGNPLELSKENGVHVSYLWNDLHTFPVAEVKNAAQEEIAYTSFEGDDKGRWTFNEANIISGGITGKHSYNGAMSRVVNPNKSYILTAWSAGTVSGPDGVPGQLLATKQGWSLYKWDINNTEGVVITGSQIDEVRLYPVGAQMTTYVYEPFVGMAAVDDANNTILYYIYDGLNRLQLIRNIDRDIVKQYEYKYNQVINPCSNTTADWQATGVKRCITSGQHNLPTGEEEEEQRDQNNCSNTYLQTRWISLGNTGNCTGGGGQQCTGANKRIVNGVCETATKVFVSSQKIGRTWHCTYKWVWSDGYESAPFTETSSTACNAGDIEL